MSNPPTKFRPYKWFPFEIGKDRRFEKEGRGGGEAYQVIVDVDKSFPVSMDHAFAGVQLKTLAKALQTQPSFVLAAIMDKAENAVHLPTLCERLGFGIGLSRRNARALLARQALKGRYAKTTLSNPYRKPKHTDYSQAGSEPAYWSWPIPRTLTLILPAGQTLHVQLSRGRSGGRSVTELPLKPDLYAPLNTALKLGLGVLFGACDACAKSNKAWQKQTAANTAEVGVLEQLNGLIGLLITEGKHLGKPSDEVSAMGELKTEVLELKQRAYTHMVDEPHSVFGNFRSAPRAVISALNTLADTVESASMNHDQVDPANWDLMCDVFLYALEVLADSQLKLDTNDPEYAQLITPPLLKLADAFVDRGELKGTSAKFQKNVATEWRQHFVDSVPGLTGKRKSPFLSLIETNLVFGKLFTQPITIADHVTIFVEGSAVRLARRLLATGDGGKASAALYRVGLAASPFLLTKSERAALANAVDNDGTQAAAAIKKVKGVTFRLKLTGGGAGLTAILSIASAAVAVSSDPKLTQKNVLALMEGVSAGGSSFGDALEAFGKGKPGTLIGLRALGGVAAFCGLVSAYQGLREAEHADDVVGVTIQRCDLVANSFATVSWLMVLSMGGGVAGAVIGLLATAAAVAIAVWKVYRLHRMGATAGVFLSMLQYFERNFSNPEVAKGPAFKVLELSIKSKGNQVPMFYAAWKAVRRRFWELDWWTLDFERAHSELNALGFTDEQIVEATASKKKLEPQPPLKLENGAACWVFAYENRWHACVVEKKVYDDLVNAWTYVLLVKESKIRLGLRDDNDVVPFYKKDESVEVWVISQKTFRRATVVSYDPNTQLGEYVFRVDPDGVEGPVVQRLTFSQVRNLVR